MIDWPSKVPQFQRERIKQFLEAFSEFVKQNHSGNDQQDEYVRTQWDSLRTMIYANPADTYKHSEYVQKMNEQPTYAYYRSQRQPPTKDKNLQVPGTPIRMKRKKSSEQIVFELDKNKLQEYAHDTILLIKKNNKEMLKL